MKTESKKTENTRTEIFYSECGKYRAVCEFNQNPFVTLVWWVYIQRKETYKPFFKRTSIDVWRESDRCWLSNSPDSIKQLKDKAMELLDRTYFLPQRLLTKGMEIK